MNKDKRFIVWDWGGSMLGNECRTLFKSDDFDEARKFAYDFVGSKEWLVQHIVYIDDMTQTGMFGICGRVVYNTFGWEQFINFDPVKEGFLRSINDVYDKFKEKKEIENDITE